MIPLNQEGGSACRASPRREISPPPLETKTVPDQENGDSHDEPTVVDGAFDRAHFSPYFLRQNPRPADPRWRRIAPSLFIQIYAVLRTPLVVIIGTLTAQIYVDDILRSVLLPFLSHPPRLLFNKIIPDHTRHGLLWIVLTLTELFRCLSSHP
ncbi:hypothetical protein LAZ67_11002342 [Cordylochernes scorpioides]|uniref:Uncharacterized protein n=1 Tax=Cordylochernes scorpioides TaxID=51811 RepID=A0ABY6KZ72_9ARAC|nr:hypothetical protein LAZ67_11002342 [Cordylochernes scorpioides]